MSNKVIEPRKTMFTLAELWSGKNCPHETECACRTSSWCPEAGRRKFDGEGDYPMTHLTGCSFAYDHCCCRVLDEIEELADKYLKQACISEPPVPMDIITLFDPKRPIEIRRLPLRRFLGCTWLVDKEWVIHLNSNSLPEESNFTAFHEGFHVICGNSGLAFKRAGERYKKVSERLADYFSASILMPRNLVYSFWPKVEDPILMASIFGVPQSVMKEWLIRLRILI